MRKKIILSMLCITLVCLATACGAKTEKPAQQEAVEAAGQVQQPAEEPAEESEKEEPAVELSADNMIQNPDFAEGVGTWMTYLENGEGTIDVNPEGQLVIDVANAGTLDYSVQAYYDGIVLDEGVVYKFAFDMAASKPRTVVWRVQLNGGDYSPYFMEEIAATTQMQRYEYEFKMEKPSDPAPRLCFNVGMYEADGDLGAHQIYLDNFEYYVLDDSGKVAAGAGMELPNVNISQVGYLPMQQKKATLRGEEIGETFEIFDVATNECVYTQTIDDALESDNLSAGEHCAVVDFSDFTTEGTYKIVADGCGESYEFKIASDVYDQLLDDTLRMMYLQRCGQELSGDLAGDYAHPVCHAEGAVIYGTDTATDVSGGWHDAGDYGRYVVSGAKTVADLLLAYEKYPEAFDDDLNIPESGNGIPDILDEVKYELDWLLKMQAEDGGVYHKVTCKNFPGTVFPQEETEQLVISPVSNTATGDFAAVMAMAARSYKEIDPAFADTCLGAAKKAMEYFEANKGAKGFTNPSEIVTGEYPDDNETDEYFWALAELYKTTGDATYGDKIKECKIEEIPQGLGWQAVGLYGLYTYMSCKDADVTVKSAVSSALESAVTQIEEKRIADTYGSTLGEEYPWGSNMTIANHGMLYLIMEMEDEASSQLSYLLGNNANSYCFVTGYGTLSPTGTHHRPSQATGKTMKGMLVGGPNSNLEDPYAQATLKDAPPAKCYVDNEQSFSCNEVTIYWNSPLVYLIAGMK